MIPSKYKKSKKCGVTVESDFDRFNKKIVEDMENYLKDLNFIWSEIKKDNNSIQYYKEYIQLYKSVIELYYIGSRKTLKPNEDLDSGESDSDKLKKFAEVLNGAVNEE